VTAVAQAGTAKGDVTVQELTRTQGLIARRMAESRATIPTFELRTEIDMDACVALRAELKALGGDVPSYNDMVVKACALALREFPRANGSYRDARFELYSRVNVGVAVAAADSLVVPTVFDADRKSLREIARDTRALAERVRAGAITPPELSGGTFTVSNLGMYGVTDFTAVINPPQAAILAVGELAPRPVVGAGGALVARNTMNVTLACDHRILYGAAAAEFLARIRALLERPLALAF
jgi:pyruvate dehydrogenase E2 component (dihydrolipoamide acetyltransferase)